MKQYFRKYSRNRSMAVIVGCVVLIGMVLIVVVLLNAWMAMLLLGGLHHEVSQDIPAVSFGGSVLIALALSFVGAFFKSTRRK